MGVGLGLGLLWYLIWPYLPLPSPWGLAKNVVTLGGYLSWGRGGAPAVDMPVDQEL